MLGENVVPGGPSGDPSSPDYATQLAVWLTGEYHRVNMSPAPGGPKEWLVPAP